MSIPSLLPMKPFVVVLTLLVATPVLAQTSWHTLSDCGVSIEMPNLQPTEADHSTDSDYIHAYSVFDPATSNSYGLICLRVPSVFPSISDPRTVVSAAAAIYFDPDQMSPIRSPWDVSWRGHSGRAFLFNVNEVNVNESHGGYRMHVRGYRTSSDTVVFAVFGALSSVDGNLDANAQHFYGSLTF